MAILQYFTAFVGLALMLGALLVAPPIQQLIGAPIASTRMQVIAWVLATVIFLTGAALLVLRRRVSGINLFLFMISSAGALLVAEGILALTGFQTPYRIVHTIPDLADWITVDSETGLRIAPDNYWNPGWPITRQGFGGTELFEETNCEDYEARVLFLGDSFTFGINASAFEKSFVAIISETLQAQMQALVWNTAIPGIGQPQQWDALQRYFPLLEPHVVVVGFCLNDFVDNQYPVDGFYVFEPAQWIPAYATDVNGNRYKMDPEQAYRRALQAAERPIEYVAASRVGFLLLHGFHRLLRLLQANGETGMDLQNRDEQQHACPGYEKTEVLLRKIRDYVTGHGAELLLIPIPFTDDLDKPTQCYTSILELCETHDIPYVAIREQLSLDDYFMPPDDHWNDSGHAKVAEAVLPRLYELLLAQDVRLSNK